MLGRFLLDLIRGRNPVQLDPLAASAQPAQAEVSKDTRQELISLDSINFLVKGIHGWFLANRYDRFLGQAIIRYGECCEIEQQFLVSFLKLGDNVIEVGSNIGVHTVGLAKAVGRAGRVVAVEPQPAIFRVLSANLAINSLNNVIAHQCGCGPSRGQMSVPIVDYSAESLHNSGSVSLLPESTGHLVEIVPVDELSSGLSAVRLLKIDVEGMEFDVLSGARAVIDKFRPILYVENDRVEKSKDLIELIMSMGYRLWWHAPPLFNPRNHFAVQENEYPNIISLNMLCLASEMVASFDVSGLQEVTDSTRHPMGDPVRT